MRFFISFLVFLIAAMAFGQVKIGNDINNIDAASILELESDSRVFVPTRMSSAEMNAVIPLKGAIVYNTDLDCIFVYDGSVWKSLCNSENGFFVGNGITKTESNAVALGGELTEPTSIVTNDTNTLALEGLEVAEDNTDMLMTVEETSGVLRKRPITSLVQKQEVVLVATEGQNQFNTPLTITDPIKIDVYRNGIKIDFNAIGNNTIELETDVICYRNDEIRIVQFF